jgi:hypothetical protein
MFFAARRWEMKNCLFVLILCAATSLFLDKSASATNLGVANDYNLFVFENLYGYNSDSWGNIAAGGNACLSSYHVGSTLNGNNARLVVGGNLTWESGGGRVGSVCCITLMRATRSAPKGLCRPRLSRQWPS